MENKKILIVIGVILVAAVVVVGFKLIQPERPTIEQAEEILTESIQKTLALTSLRATGEGSFKVKDGETILVEIGLEDFQSSVVNLFDFAEQDSKMAGTINVMMNFEVLAGFIETTVPSEDLEGLEQMMMGMDLIEVVRGLGEANISIAGEMKSIDFDSYTKIAEITGLRELITEFMGPFIAGMVMGEIEAELGIWQKTPADPEMREMMVEKFEGIEALMENFMKVLYDVYYVKEVLPNAEINGVAVYNFVVGTDLDKLKKALPGLIEKIAVEMDEDIDRAEIAEMEEAIAEKWPIIKRVVETIEKDYRIYICQETRFTIKEIGIVSVDLSNLMVLVYEIVREQEVEMTTEEKAEFEKIKEVLKNISIVVTSEFKYSDHNVLFVITPPEEYEVVEPFMPPMIEPIPPMMDFGDAPFPGFEF